MPIAHLNYLSSLQHHFVLCLIFAGLLSKNIRISLFEKTLDFGQIGTLRTRNGSTLHTHFRDDTINLTILTHAPLSSLRIYLLTSHRNFEYELEKKVQMHPKIIQKNFLQQHFDTTHTQRAIIRYTFIVKSQRP